MYTSHRDNQPPLVSVIIPAYNAEEFIAQAIQSVVAQTYRSHEIIVVDDGSTDKTRDILKEFDGQIRCVYQENRGPSAARNAGINLAQGRYICFLDADDLWTPDKLEVQFAFMEANPDIAFVFSDHEEFNEEGVVLSSFLGEKHKTFSSFPIVAGCLENAFGKLVLENCISTPTVMVRKTCLEKTGLFDEEIWSVEDRDLWLRIAAHCNVACLPNIFCKRRVHQSNISKQSELTLHGRITILERNRRNFPFLVPSEIWDCELANHYCQLGYLLLQKGERKRALRAGSTSLAYALRHITKRRMVSFYPWRLGIGLIPASLLGWQCSRSLFRPMKGLSGGEQPERSTNRKSE
jgi:glycosyltransferase involved in cell wall biosynthesis